MRMTYKLRLRLSAILTVPLAIFWFLISSVYWVPAAAAQTSPPQNRRSSFI